MSKAKQIVFSVSIDAQGTPGSFLDVNYTATLLLGYTNSQFKDLPFITLFDEEELIIVGDAFVQLLTKRQHQLVVQIRSEIGLRYWVTMRLFLMDQHDPPYVIVVCENTASPHSQSANTPTPFPS